MSEEQNENTETAAAENNEQPATKQATSGSEANAASFVIKRIFVKDLSFEVPNGYEAFATLNSAPKVAQDLNTEINKIDDHHFMVTLKITITVKGDNDKVAYLIEVHQAGIFEIKSFPNEALKHALTAQCPTILYPYVRETVDSIVVKGGFPPLALPPLNFDVIAAKAAAEIQARMTAGVEGQA